MPTPGRAPAGPNFSQLNFPPRRGQASLQRARPPQSAVRGPGAAAREAEESRRRDSEAGARSQALPDPAGAAPGPSLPPPPDARPGSGAVLFWL